MHRGWQCCVLPRWCLNRSCCSCWHQLHAAPVADPQQMHQQKSSLAGGACPGPEVLWRDLLSLAQHGQRGDCTVRPSSFFPCRQPAFKPQHPFIESQSACTMSHKTSFTIADKKGSPHGSQMFYPLQHYSCFMTCLNDPVPVRQGMLYFTSPMEMDGRSHVGSEPRSQEAVPADRPLGLAAR